MFLSPLIPALALVLGVSAAHSRERRVDWVRGLDDCWRKCLQDTDDGCGSSRCICDASQDDDYLPPAVSCMKSKCDASEFTLDMGLFLPLTPYCYFAGNPIPEDVLSSAGAAATVEPGPTSTRKNGYNHYTQRPITTHGEDELTKIITTTITKTATDAEGNKLQIVVPVVFGPDSISSGKAVTSTLEAAETSSAESPSSAAASPSPTLEDPAPAPTENPQPQETTAEAKPADRTSNSNGSPFENMQAGAAQWGVSSAVVGLSFLAGVFLRM